MMNSATYSKTKIISTLGPASSSKEVLRHMLLNGVDVCRLNFSHGTHEDHLKSMQFIRELNDELGLQVAILADLQGPKLRIGEVENNCAVIKTGDTLKIVNTKCLGTSEKVYLSYEQFPQDVEKGENILINDGKIKLEVIDTNNVDCVTTKVIFGGELSSRKGVNLPNTKISLPCLTEKDITDAKFALQHNVDWIALSFVRNSQDVIDLKKLISAEKKNTYVISKIEKPEALFDIDKIIEASDGIMVARGDLGVEIQYHEVPVIQKQLVEKCIEASKPVIIATQMLESMISNFRPTRAEATDVANAVIDGADTLMLSGETSVGIDPPAVITAMHNIIDYTEDIAYNYLRGKGPQKGSKAFLADSICYNAAKMAQQTQAAALIVFTYSGYTAFKVAGYRPKANIYAFSANKSLIPKMSLLWATKAYYHEFFEHLSKAVEHTIDFLKETGELKEGDIVIHVGSAPLGKAGNTNLLKISEV